MKRLLSLSLVMLMTLVALGQTQQGYVKTKGRMVDGKHVHGQGLKGATISVHGRTSILVKGDDGAFSFMVTEPQFRLDSVRKKGYRLVDMDALGKTYSPSPNPIYLVMETPEQQLQDQLDAERKIRRALTDQLHQREDEIETLKKMQKITDEEYRKALQKLYEDTGQNDQLVNDMVERYSKIDYDLLSEFDQKISELILNGELAKADSMLRTKGDINERVSQYKKHEAINAKEREELSQRQEQLEQSEALIIQERDDLANDCYRKFEIFKMQHENDSAAYYLELRAELDTTNVDWQNDAGDFVTDYIADFDKAMSYYQYGLEQSLRQCGEDKTKIALQYNNIGIVYYCQGDYNKSLEYHDKALNNLKPILGEIHPDIAFSYLNKGSAYHQLNDFEKALDCFEIALHIDSLIGVDYTDIATIYNNIGTVYEDLGNLSKALEYHNKAFTILRTEYGEEHPDIAISCNNIGVVYYRQGEYDSAIEYLEKAKAIQEAIFGENHPALATTYNNIGSIHLRKNEFYKALEYYEKSLSIRQSILGESHPLTATTYSNIGLLYLHQNLLDEAEEKFEKAIAIEQVILGENHADLATSYNNLSGVYYRKNDFDKSLEYLNKALTIRLSIFGENHIKTKTTINNIAQIEYDKAIEGNTIASFNESHIIIASIVSKGTTAERQNMSGENVILEFCNWYLDSTTSIFKIIDEKKGKPVDILAFKHGIISQFHLENTSGINFIVKQVDKEEKQHINKAYKEWKEQNTPKSNPH